MDLEELEDALAELLQNGSAKMRRVWEEKQMEPLFKDLRNATLLTRATDRDFGFSHTSIQEYFLAQYLFEMGIKGQQDNFHMPNLSHETIDFLIDLLEKAEAYQLGAFEKTWQQDLKGNFQQESDWTFRLYLKDQQRDTLLLTRPEQMNLTGIDLSKQTLKGESHHLLDLSSVCFKNAQASQLKLRYVNLDHSDWTGAFLSSSEILDSEVNKACFDKAILSGTWRKLTLHDTHFLGSDHTGLSLLHCKPVPDPFVKSLPTHPLVADQIILLDRHFGSIQAVAFSPDGSTFLSASDDKSIKLWDLNTKKCIHSFEEHSSAVFACQFSPDGSTFLSASSDKSIKLWDVASRKCLYTFHSFGEEAYAVFKGKELMRYNEAAGRYLRYTTYDSNGYPLAQYYLDELEDFPLKPVDYEGV